jgi:hypothetical protein
MSDDVRDECRREVAASGLTPAAVTHLTRDALGTIDFAQLAPVKKLLKQFFSDETWKPADDDALAALVGPGAGWWRHELDNRFDFEFGWRAGAFRLELSALANGGPPAPSLPAPVPAVAGTAAAADLAATFDGPVAPEATPNPRSIRFVTPPIHNGPSRWYESRDATDDPRVVRLFTEFTDVINVLVGPDFVAVGLSRPDRWEQLLDPVLRVVTAEFASGTEPDETEPADPGPASPWSAPPRRGGAAPAIAAAKATALDRAWHEIGALQPGRPADLVRILSAVDDPETALRQVAARVLVGAEAPAAENAWSRLLDDPSRTVRRATVDAMVDAGRPELRPLLERALADTDAWTRWKALRGLVELGIEPSRGVVLRLTDDPDFRVRLETGRALRTP